MSLEKYRQLVIQSLINYRNWGGVSAPACVEGEKRFVVRCFDGHTRPERVATILAQTQVPSYWRNKR